MVNPKLLSQIKTIGKAGSTKKPGLQISSDVIRKILKARSEPAAGQPAPAPAPTPVPTPVPAPVPTPLEITNPFLLLPFPSPGDRIRADDFKRLSQCLQMIYEISVLSGSLIGASYGEARLVLLSQQYLVERVMSVFGSELSSGEDSAFDSRKVIQVIPLELGERQVAVVVSEAVETRRFVPNLLGRTYKDASEQLRAMVGDLPSSPSVTSSQLVGMSLGQAKENITK